MEFLGSILEIGKTVWDTTREWFGYVNRLDANMQSLDRKIDELSNQEFDINAALTYEEQRPGKRRKREVGSWLEDVQEMKDDVQRLGRDVAEMNFVTRVRKGKSVVEKIQEVEKLQQMGRFSTDLVIDALPTSGQSIPTTAKFVGETTSARNKDQVWACLMDDEVRRIGVFGMGGAGKTTIMHHINNLLVNGTRNFDDVIWVTVSKAFDIRKVQDEIAKALNFHLTKNEDETRRALALYSQLSRKKRYVLILDDLWEAFRLEDVGVPEPTTENGCKLVLTTRSYEVCRRMGCRKVEVELLTEQETLDLFMSKAFDDLQTTGLAPEVEEIATKVAKECACLPLAIVTIAGTMRGETEICEWSNALNELISLTKDIWEEEGVLFERLKFSYGRLKDEKLQHCFLYCALYPEDHEIDREELIHYWINEGLIAEMKNREAMFVKGHAILNKLINTCLLEKATIRCAQDYVIMHDLMRDMALKIAKTSPRFMVKAGEGLERVPFGDWSEDLERVSLMYNKIEEFPSRPPICPRLTTLLMRDNPLHVVPDSFFLHMKSLEVLDLSRTRIKSLSESMFSNLENLHALLLGNCHALEYVPSLEKLKSLEVLKLSGCYKIQEVPQGTEELVHLKVLDLSFTSIKSLPESMFSNLGNLRALFLRFIPALEHVPSLEKLKALEELSLEGCGRIQDVPRGIEQLPNFKVLNLSFTGIKSLPESMFSNLENLQALILRNCGALEHVPSLEKFKALKDLKMNNCGNLQQVPQGIDKLFNLINLDLSDNKNLQRFPGLEYLCRLSHLQCLRIDCTEVKVSAEELFCLKQLKVVSAEFHNEQELMSYVTSKQCQRLEEYSLSSFQETREVVATKNKYSVSLQIGRCHDLKSLLDFPSLGDARGLNTRVRLTDCSGIESIISFPSSSSLEEEDCNQIPLRSVEVLELRNLPNLRVLFENGVLVQPHNCFFLNLKYLTFQRCSSIRSIFPAAKLLQNLPNLESLGVYGCENVEDVILGLGEVEISSHDDSRIHHQDDNNTIRLTNLRTLHLDGLPRLQSIYKGTMVCEALEYIHVRRCPSLRRLPLSLHMDGEQASAPLPPPALRGIGGEEEWWESLEWHDLDPRTKTTLQAFLKRCVS